MSENDAPKPNEPKEKAGPPEGSDRPVVPGRKWKTGFVIVVALIAIGLTAFSSIKYESTHKAAEETQKPSPAYTGQAPLSIAKIQEAYDSNNDFVLVVTPCKDVALNNSITDVVVQAANKIRSVDKIYMGVFILPANESLAYPTVVMRLFGGTTASSLPITLREDITLDKIYDQYLARKFLRN